MPRTASSPSTVARTLPRPIGPRTRLERALSVEHLAGPDDPLEAHVVDPGEEGELAPVRLCDEHGDGAGLGERLDHLHARHDRVARESARSAVVLGHGLARDHPLTRARARAPRRRAGRGRGAGGSPRSGSSEPCRPDSGAGESAPPLSGRDDFALSARRSQPLAATVRVALGRADRHARSRPRSPRTRAEARPSARRRWPAPAAALRGSGQLAAQLRRSAAATGSPSRAARSILVQRLAARELRCAQSGTCSRRAGAATSRTVTRRGTAGSARTSLASDSCAASRASSGSRSDVPRELLDRAARAVSQSASSACASPSFARVTRDRVAKPLVDERSRFRAGGLRDLTPAAAWQVAPRLLVYGA